MMLTRAPKICRVIISFSRSVKGFGPIFYLLWGLDMHYVRLASRKFGYGQPHSKEGSTYMHGIHSGLEGVTF